VAQDRTSKGSNFFIVKCSSPDCQWRIYAKKSRSRDTQGLWAIDPMLSSQQHSVLCLPTEPRLHVRQVAVLPEVHNLLRDNRKASVKSLLERVMDKYGLKVNSQTMRQARLRAQGSTRAIAEAQLLELSQLCEAFVVKNPGTKLVIEKSAGNVLERIFICPGANEKALPVLLSNFHNDGFFGKNLEFNFQVLSMSAMTNQRSVFLYSFAIVPREDEEQWRWFLQQHKEGAIALVLHSGQKIFRGDREKGEAAAVAIEFPNTPKADCTYHIRQNMHRLRLFNGCSEPDAWRGVAEAKTMGERDILWEHLKVTQPKVAAYLQQIPRIQWQTCELLQLGLHTHSTTTNNTAEQVGKMLLTERRDGLPIRYRTPGAMVKGLLEIFSEQSQELRTEAERIKLGSIIYSDYALGIWSLENMDSTNYRVAQVGPVEWCVKRMILTDKDRHVRLGPDGLAHCDCNLYAETEVICRHIMAVAKSSTKGRWAHLSANPFGDIWLNSRFVEAFEHFAVIMPSPDEIAACAGTMYPNPLYMPAVVRGRGRPRVKRIKRKIVRLRKKMRVLAGVDVDERVRHCSVCFTVGHSKKTCPVREKFKS
jgi:hypothetical protein